MEHLLPDTVLGTGCANLIRTIPGEMDGCGERLRTVLGRDSQLQAYVVQAGWHLLL